MSEATKEEFLNAVDQIVATENHLIEIISKTSNENIKKDLRKKVDELRNIRQDLTKQVME